MKHLVYIWVQCVGEEEPFQTQATVHADNSVEAVKKVIKDIEKLWGECEMTEAKSFRPSGEEPTVCTVCNKKTLITNHHEDMVLCENPTCPDYLRFKEVGE